MIEIALAGVPASSYHCFQDMKSMRTFPFEDLPV